MVSIASSEELLLGDAKSMLLRELLPLVGRGNLDEAFAVWLLGETKIPFKLSDAICTVAEHSGGQRNYHDVAILGFAAASNLLNDTELNALKEGLIWLSGREPLLDGQPQGFCTDVVALLGVVLGAVALNHHLVTVEVHEWFNKFINQSFQNRLHDWQKCILVAVCQLGGISGQKSVPEASNLADVRIALSSHGVLDYDTPSQEEDQVKTLLLMKLDSCNDMTSGRAALRLAAFDSIQRVAPVVNLLGPSVEDVARLLNNIPAAFRRWTWERKARTRGGEARKWYIDNEYHVQNLLYFLLSPIFPDLKDEDYTPSVGQMHPRADLLIPSLFLIIEVKFMRASDKPQDIIEQVAADSSLYLISGSSYRQIIAFIWDDSKQSQEHDYMRNGLKQLPGVVEAVVLSRPGNLMV